MTSQTVTIELQEIGDDDLYRLPSFAPLQPLKDSIRLAGLLSPLILEPSPQGGLRIVCGFRRLQALRELEFHRAEARILTDPASSAERFRIALAENAAHRTFNAAEVSWAIKKLRLMQVKDEEIWRSFFPLMRLGSNPNLLVLLAPIADLPPHWQQTAAEDRLSFEVIKDLADLTDVERDAIWRLFQTLRLGKNRQREFLLLLQDVARLSDSSLCALLESSAFREVIDSPLTPSQKSERLKQILWQMRYPRYSEQEEAFSELIKRMRPPKGVSIHHAPYFQDEEMTVAFSFGSAREFRNRLDWLEEQYREGKIDELVQLI